MCQIINAFDWSFCPCWKNFAFFFSLKIAKMFQCDLSRPIKMFMSSRLTFDFSLYIFMYFPQLFHSTWMCSMQINFRNQKIFFKIRNKHKILLKEIFNWCSMNIIIIFARCSIYHVLLNPKQQQPKKKNESHLVKIGKTQYSNYVYTK